MAFSQTRLPLKGTLVWERLRQWSERKCFHGLGNALSGRMSQGARLSMTSLNIDQGPATYSDEKFCRARAGPFQGMKLQPSPLQTMRLAVEG